MDDHVYPLMYRIEKEHWWFAARQHILERYIASRIATPPKARVLDVGCGTGAILEMLSGTFQAYGTDLSPHAIEFCRQRGLQRLFLGTLSGYPRADPFGLVTLFDVLEHVEDDRSLLGDIYNLLEENGDLLISVPAFPSLWTKHDEILHHKRRYTKSSLRSVVNAAGFDIRHLTFFNTFLFPVALVRRGIARAFGAENVNDLEIPSSPVNTILRRVFSLEAGLLPHVSLPVGLSLLCWAKAKRS